MPVDECYSSVDCSSAVVALSFHWSIVKPEFAIAEVWHFKHRQTIVIALAAKIAELHCSSKRHLHQQHPKGCCSLSGWVVYELAAFGDFATAR